jgi:FKBP-type peptidyl-prolyl cis-trans isomerase FkpA
MATIANFDAPIKVSELRWDDIVEGTGNEAHAHDVVTIHYTGALASNGEIFDSSHKRGEQAEFPLDQLIQGWQEGIPGMKVGGTRRLYIPAEKGYGERGAGETIPPNSDLIFDIELFATQS